MRLLLYNLLINIVKYSSLKTVQCNKTVIKTVTNSLSKELTHKVTHSFCG